VRGKASLDAHVYIKLFQSARTYFVYKTAALALFGRRGLKPYHHFMFLRVLTTGDYIDYINIIIIRSLIMTN
jgi:hypothetical protein